MKSGDQYQTWIEDLTDYGEGVARVNGFPVFVRDALPGDLALIRIDRVRKRFALADAESIVTQSVDRVSPPCGQAFDCGGCQTMALSYPAQLTFKEKRVRDALERIGKIKTEVRPILGMEDPWHYRNKGQFPVRRKDGEPAIGFYRQGSHEIVETPRCYLQHPVMDKAVHALKEYVKESGVLIYQESTNQGLLRHLVVKTGFASAETMVVPVINGESLPQQDLFIQRMKEHVPGLVSVVLNHHTRPNNVVMGDRLTLVYGKDHITEQLLGMNFRISASAFFQVNPIQTEILYTQALNAAQIQKGDTVLDLYCGIGTLALLAAQRAKRVLGVESVDQAVQDARMNAELNQFDNVTFLSGKAENLLPQLAQEGERPRVVFLDPPRKGCDPAVLEAVVTMGPETLVYVSCHPGTLARDLRILEDRGYQTRWVQPVDLFPHTVHVECVVLMSKVEN